MQPKPVSEWHAIVESRDLQRLSGLLADDVVFHSPVVHTPQAGRAITLKYLTAALHVLNNASFRYVNECTSGSMACLEFETVIDGVTINGVDLIHWNDDGRIVTFKVMIRPLKAINKLHGLMAEMLTRI